MADPIWMRLSTQEWEAIKDFWPVQCKREQRVCEEDDEGTTLQRVTEITSPFPEFDIALVVRMAIAKAKKERDGSGAVRTAKYLKPLVAMTPEEFQAEAVAFSLTDDTSWNESRASCYRK